MATAATPPALDRYPPAAGPIHTILLLVVFGAFSFWFKILADQLNAAANPNRVRFYAITIVCEWLLFAFVVVGVRRSGASVAVVLGDRWRSARQVLRDIGIAAGFWIVSLAILFCVSKLLHITQSGRDILAIVPHSAIEIALWIAVSITAGICEEAVFRGYLQRQFIVLTKSAPAGILLSGVAFGVAHAYQGFRMVILISVFGTMFGILAHWRGTVRPGMITHAWQDALSGIVAGLMGH
jgi:membrane protease YdiL (CAAX protease family)